MTESIIVALITGILALVGTVYATKKQGERTLMEMREQSKLADANLEAKLEKHQAVTETKLSTLTEEVRKHNNFAERIPVLEEKISVANHRIDDLEKARAG